MNFSKKLLDFTVSPDEYPLNEMLKLLNRTFSKKDIEISDEQLEYFLHIMTLKDSYDFYKHEYCIGFIYPFLSRCSTEQIIKILNAKCLPISIASDIVVLRKIDASKLLESTIYDLGIYSFYLTNEDDYIERIILESGMKTLSDETKPRIYIGSTYSKNHENVIPRLYKLKKEIGMNTDLIKPITEKEMLQKLKNTADNLLNIGVVTSPDSLPENLKQMINEVFKEETLEYTNYSIDDMQMIENNQTIMEYLKLKIIPVVTIVDNLDSIKFFLRLKSRGYTSQNPKFDNAKIITKLEYITYFEKLDYFSQRIFYDLFFKYTNQYDLVELIQSFATKKENVVDYILKGNSLPIYSSSESKIIEMIEDKYLQKELLEKNLLMFFNNYREYNSFIRELFEKNKMNLDLLNILLSVDFHKYNIFLNFDIILNNIEFFNKEMLSKLTGYVYFNQDYAYDNQPIFTKHLESKGITEEYAKILGFKRLIDM